MEDPLMPARPAQCFPGSLIIAVLAACVAPIPVEGAAPWTSSKIAPGLADQIGRKIASGRDEERIPVIVQTWGAPAPEVLTKIEDLGGSRGALFTSIPGFPALVPAKALASLAAEPHVRALSYDWPIDAHAERGSPARPRVEARPTEHLSSLTGNGVTVAVLDSGISLSADLVSTPPTLLLEIDIVEPDGLFEDPFGHGTLVAGVIAGSGFASSLPGAKRTFQGIAPGARLISVKVLDHDGTGSVGTVLSGIDWVIQNHEVFNIRVINLSLGHPVDESYVTDPLCQALEMAWRAGMVVVASAGNSGGRGYATIASPANDPMILTVGALEDWKTAETSDDLVASFSSRGPTAIDGIIKPDLVAAGSDIVTLRSAGSRLDSSFPARRLRYSDYSTVVPADGDGDSPYIALTGTSLAAPRVAGAAAILLQQDPGATPNDVKARLMIGAQKMNDTIVARGAGLLDVHAALALGAAGVVSSDARSPRLLVSLGPDGRRSVQVQEVGTAWGDPITWSSEKVWGSKATWGLSPQWTDRIAWRDGSRSTSALAGFDAELAVWGGR
jgi:serine protease AprX